MRVLGLYIAVTPEADEEAVLHAYYSLLLNDNVARAQVAARKAFEAAPADGVRRMVYAFSLLKQHRAPEALTVLSDAKEGAASEPIPLGLIRASILAQLGRKEQARASLSGFNAALALPEEADLARRISSQLDAQATVAGAPSRN
jgi:hypothetical protein